MDDEPSNASPTRRDIVGAWVLCAVLAALALGLAGNLHAGVPPAATLATEISPCLATPSSLCRPSMDAERRRVSSVAELHHLTRPRPRAGEQLRPG
jgi:hypothetical protein